MGEVRLRLDAERWREHLGVVSRATPGLVPVIKGNGYGFGRTRLAQEAATLGADTIAVGVAREVARVRRHFDGDVVIMQPWDAGDDAAQACLADPKVIENILTSKRIITGMANALGGTQYSAEFNRLMTCPDLNSPLTPVR